MKSERSAVSEFVWDVDKTGHRWIETSLAFSDEASAPPREQLYLSSGVAVGAQGNVVRRYKPLRLYTGLFRTFAETEPTRAGVQAFADEYGLLGVGEAILLPATPEEEVFMGRGETLKLWTQEIFTLRTALSMWQMAQASDVAGLSRYIRWQGQDSVFFKMAVLPELQGGESPPSVTGFSLVASRKVSPEILARFSCGDMVRPALCHIQQLINERLSEYVSPLLLWDPEGTQLSLYLVPKDLLGALWLQFGEAVAGNRSHRRCLECERWFVIAPDTARSDKEYCANTCRQRAYYRRTKEAVKLHTDGVPIKEIANRLDTDTTKVKGWIERAKDRKRSRKQKEGKP